MANDRLTVVHGPNTALWIILTSYPIGNQSTVGDGTLRHAARKSDVIQLGLIWQPTAPTPAPKRPSMEALLRKWMWASCVMLRGVQDVEIGTSIYY